MEHLSILLTGRFMQTVSLNQVFIKPSVRESTKKQPTAFQFERYIPVVAKRQILYGQNRKYSFQNMTKL